MKSNSIKYNTPSEYEDKMDYQNINPDQEISLWIDSYDDIFSDFDPRPFSARNISDDFLYEVKKVSRETNFHISELFLQIPEKIRNAETETIIIKRLHTFFVISQHFYLNKKKGEKKKGILFVLIGILLMLGASYVSSSHFENLLMHIVLIIFEPAGWFFVWVGLEDLITNSRKEKPELDFYNKMSKSKIVFKNI